MEIENWMTRRVYAVKPLDSILHARELMERHRVNQLPVVRDGHLVGIITDRDVRDAFPSVFAASSTAKPLPGELPTDPKDITIESVMTPHVLTLGPKSTVVEAARLMRRERMGSIPVLDGKHLVGIMTRSDVLDAFVALAEAVGPSSDGPLVRTRKEERP